MPESTSVASKDAVDLGKAIYITDQRARNRAGQVQSCIICTIPAKLAAFEEAPVCLAMTSGALRRSFRLRELIKLIFLANLLTKVFANVIISSHKFIFENEK